MQIKDLSYAVKYMHNLSCTVIIIHFGCITWTLNTTMNEGKTIIYAA